jgi:NADPH2:quinone reductase
MRAILCTEWGGPEKLTLATLPDPVAMPGQVVIGVRAAGVNFPDVLIVQCKYQLRPDLPFVPGSEVAGEVLAVGEGVTTPRVGDRVLAACRIGGFAEQVAVPAGSCHVLPGGVGYPEAAVFMLAYCTVWHALTDRAAARPGETLLVLGAAGGVGLAAVQIGKALGLRVIAAASSPGKLAVCAAHGAGALIDYSAEDLRAGIARATDGQGPDIIFDPVGGALSEPAFRSIAWRGRHLVVGFAEGAIPSLPLNLPLLKGAALVGVSWGGYLKREHAAYRIAAAELLAWLASGRLKPLISARYALQETPRALQDMAARRAIGKLVIEP